MRSRSTAPDQPPLLDLPPAEVNAALGTLALGGAERIVLDWAARTAARHRVRLVVLREVPDEWPAPPGVEVIRLHGVALEEKLPRWAPSWWPAAIQSCSVIC